MRLTTFLLLTTTAIVLLIIFPHCNKYNLVFGYPLKAIDTVNKISIDVNLKSGAQGYLVPQINSLKLDRNELLAAIYPVVRGRKQLRYVGGIPAIQIDSSTYQNSKIISSVFYKLPAGLLNRPFLLILDNATNDTLHTVFLSGSASLVVNFKNTMDTDNTDSSIIQKMLTNAILDYLSGPRSIEIWEDIISK